MVRSQLAMVIAGVLLCGTAAAQPEHEAKAKPNDTAAEPADDVEDIGDDELGDVEEVDDELGDVEEVDDDFGDVEEEVDVDAIEEIEEAGPATGFTAVVGYFHSALVHAPIGWILLVVLLDILVFFRGKQELASAASLTLAAAAASFVPAIVSGLVRLDNLGMPPEEAEHAIFHRNIMFAAFGLVLVALVLRWRGKNALEGTLRFAYLGFIIVAAAVMSYGAHEGGEMIWGDPPF